MLCIIYKIYTYNYIYDFQIHKNKLTEAYVDIDIASRLIHRYT